MDLEPGLDDHFLELGGTSLESVILLREISRHFEREFSASLLINLSTIRQLARAIETADDDQPQLDLEPETSDLLEDSGLPVEVFYQLVSLTSWWRGERTRPQSLLYGQNTNSTRAPLFYCSATSTDFDDMAVALGPEQPVYGMRSGHLVMERTHSNLETLARYYVGEILSVQPNGRYFIAGYCRGVKLAFQIALELRRRGRQVGGLFLLEQTIPIWYPGRITLFFGRESFYNPERSFEGVEEKLKLFYPDHLAIKTLPGDHDAFWQKPSVDTFVSQLQAEIDEATSASPLAVENQERKPLLPPEAHQAKIQTTKRLFVTPGEKKIRIKVRITNTSPVTWPSGNEDGPVLGYWIKAVKMPAPIFHDLGQSVPASLAPGESIVMPLEIQLPKRGKRYVIIIDLVDNRFKWFQFGGSPVATIKLLSHFVFAPFTWMRKACRLISR